MEFEQAVEDARELIRLRADGTIKGTPDQQYKAIIMRRPVTYTPVIKSLCFWKLQVVGSLTSVNIHISHLCGGCKGRNIFSYLC